MAQFGRPIADTSIGAWKDQGDGTTNIYLTIDETSPSDADYIKSESAPSSSPYATGLTTSLEDPVSSSGHIVRYRYQKSASGGAQIDLTVQLRQGYVNEGSPGTLIEAWTETNIANGWTTQSRTLAGANADAITDYTSLFIRIVANQV